MIASLRGRLSEVELTSEQAAELVLDVGGVGYLVHVGSRLLGALGPVNSEIELSVHTHVREGALTLYGFSSVTERRSFEVLVASHGIGPALGLAILSSFGTDALVRAIDNGDVEALMRVPGVGRKTAQRLVVELSGRLDGAALGAVNRDGSAQGADTVGEVVAALVALGYGPDEVRRATENLDGTLELEALLKEALRSLAPRT